MSPSSHPNAAIVISLLVALLTAVGSGNAQEGVPPSVIIAGVEYDGSGCVKSNTEFALSDDKGAVTFIFSNFSANSSGDSESSCTITLQLLSTPGWTLARAKTIARGYADLGRRVLATHTLTTSITGLSRQNEKASWFKQRGPFTDNYSFEDKFVQKRAGNIGCNEPHRFKMINSLSVQGGPGVKGLINVDSQDSDLAIELHWRRCRCPGCV